MKQSISIRPFEKSELPSILRIEEQCFDRDAWSREIFLEYADSVPRLFLVAKVGARIAGYSIASLTRGGAEIASMAVLPKYRREGVATALLKTTIQKVRRAGARAVWLMVRRQNEQAIRLYRKLGFVRVGTVPNYYEADSPGWRMRINLDWDRNQSRSRR